MQNTHPLVLVAAGAVTIASLAAAAHFTGLIPSRSETPPAQVASLPTTPAMPSAPMQPPTAKPETVVNVPPGATVSISPAGNQPPPTLKARPTPAQEPVRQARRNDAPPAPGDAGFHRTANGDNGIDVIAARPPVSQPPAYTPPPPAICHECGTVENVQEVARQGEGTGVGAVAGGVLGGVLGHQVGRGTGKDAATILGAIGGAVAGHQVEKNVRSEKQYQVSVRFDDGNFRTYTLTNTQWRPGDRVRLSGSGLAPL